MLKSHRQPPKWVRCIAGLLALAPICYGDQMLSQSVALLAFLDPNHAISLHATSSGVDLVMAHHDHDAPSDVNGTATVSVPEPAHVIRFASGCIMAKQFTTVAVNKCKDSVLHFPLATVSPVRLFVPRMPMAYSRPPPGRIPMLSLHSSTLLLI